MLRRVAGLIAVTFVVVTTSASAQFVPPPANIVATGIPPIALEWVSKLAPYTTFRPSTIVAWHSKTSAMLIRTRQGETEKLHTLRAPGEQPIPVAEFPDEVDGAWFHPHADALLIRRDNGRDRHFRLYMIDPATKRIFPISSESAVAGVPDWNQKGDRIVFTSTNHVNVDPGMKGAVTTDIFVADPLNPDRKKRVTAITGGRLTDVRFSPDQKSLVVLETVSTDESHIWRIDIATGKKSRLKAAQNNRHHSYAGMQFGRDGKSLFAISGSLGEVRRLVEIDLASGRQKALTSHLNVDVDEFSVSIPARRVAFITNEEGVSVLRFLDLDSKKELPRPALLAGEISGLKWKRGNADDVSQNTGTVLGFHLASTKSPRDVYAYNVNTTKLTRWTNGAAAGLNPFDFVEPKRVMSKNDDGLAITGLLHTPDPAKFSGRRPVVVKVHGAPAQRLRLGFIGRENYFINEMGIAIFYCEDLEPDRVTAWIATQPDLDAGRVVLMDAAGGMAAAGQPNDIVTPATKPVLVVRTDIGARFSGGNGGQRPDAALSPVVANAAKQGSPVWSLDVREPGRMSTGKSDQDFLFYVQVAFLTALLAGK